ncbi:hypothetical protein [Comamonas resistens]|uniref:hypothetical protein n=1 Tax=Comamonas resistens TaxID=3046670 RepID=UPI0039BC990E
MKSFEAIAREAYAAFQAAIPQTSGWTLPWEKLGDSTKKAWLAAARKMAEEIQQVH